jgi:hypothetical protein
MNDGIVQRKMGKQEGDIFDRWVWGAIECGFIYVELEVSGGILGGIV